MENEGGGGPRMNRMRRFREAARVEDDDNEEERAIFMNAGVRDLPVAVPVDMPVAIPVRPPDPHAPPAVDRMRDDDLADLMMEALDEDDDEQFRMLMHHRAGVPPGAAIPALLHNPLRRRADERVAHRQRRLRHFLQRRGGPARLHRWVAEPPVAVRRADVMPPQPNIDVQPNNIVDVIMADVLATEELPSRMLMHMVNEELPCMHHVADGQRCCRTLQDRAVQHPEERSFRSEETGRHPLHEAARRGLCIHTLEALCANNIDTADEQGNSPLHHLLATIGVIGVPSVQLLMSSEVCAMVDGLGCAPLHCAASNEMVTVEVLEMLVPISDASLTNTSGNTALHLYCERRNVQLAGARLLLEAHPEATLIVNRDGMTPLHLAIQKKHEEVILYLLEQDPEAAFRAGQPTSVIHTLCSSWTEPRRELVLLQALLRVAPRLVLQVDSNERTALHLLCCSSRQLPVDAIQAVVAAVPDAVDLPDQNGWMPLHHACGRGNLSEPLLRLLMSDAAVRALTRNNDTALHILCANQRRVQVVTELLAAFPGAVRQRNDYGNLPLHMACRAHPACAGIVQAVLDEWPAAVHMQTHGGETPLHVLSASRHAAVSVVQLLQQAASGIDADEVLVQQGPTAVTSSSQPGNTPLHIACFHGGSLAQIESLVTSHPEWISAPNASGATPLQILCQDGNVDPHVVSLFARLGGPEIFTCVDLLGHTPLHSAIRMATDLPALRELLRANPYACHMKTSYGDTPLHLACIRKVKAEIVEEIALQSCYGLESALASCGHELSPILLANTAGETPISIVMESFHEQAARESGCCQGTWMCRNTPVFQTLNILVRMLYFGPSNDDKSLLAASVALHRKGARVDPGFISMAIPLCSKEATFVDADGNTPLHIEVSIPVEKMAILDAPKRRGCEGDCHKRIRVMRGLLDMYPAAASMRNNHGDFPLQLAIRSGRQWSPAFATLIRLNPEALHWIPNLRSTQAPRILERISTHCGKHCVFDLLRSRPDLLT